MNKGKMDVFVFIGPPGSGKGSLSGLCTRQLGWKQLSTGNLCRKHIAQQTKIGKEIDFAIKSGKLVSDGLITQMVADWFTNGNERYDAIILDGYPRTRVQAQSFNDLLHKQLNYLNLHVVRFSLSDESIIARLCGRYICQNKDCQAVYSLLKGSSLAPAVRGLCDLCDAAIGRRKDDEEEAVRERLNVYHRHERELLSFYQELGVNVYEVKVDKALNDVFEDFKEVVGLDKE